MTAGQIAFEILRLRSQNQTFDHYISCHSDLVCRSVVENWIFTIRENEAKIEWLQNDLYFLTNH